MKKLTIPLAVVLIAGACLSLGGSDELSDMQIRAQAGTVFIHRGAEDPIEVRDEPVPLEVDDVVKTGQRGLAALRLGDGRGVKMQSNSEILIRSTRALDAEDGSVLIDATAPTIAVVDDVEARASGARFRIDSGFGATRVGSYRGDVALASPGQSPLEISRLFQTTIAAGDIGAAEPYRLNQRDAWDLHLLEEVVELESELSLLARGFTRQLGSDRPDLAYFRALADGRNVSFVSPYLKRRPIDLLIGFTVADNAKTRLKPAFREAFGYYDQGATWGITAAIMDVQPRPIVAQLEDVILGTGVVAAGGASDEAEFTVAAAQASEGDAPLGNAPESGGGGGDPGEQPPAGGGGGEGPAGGGGGGDEDGEGDQEDCEDVECVVRRAISPSPSPSDEEEDEDGGVLDGAITGGKP